jgi:hypothetical protein
MVDSGEDRAIPEAEQGPQDGTSATEPPVPDRAGGESPDDEARGPAYAARRTFRIVAPLAAVAVIVAIVLNWLLLPEREIASAGPGTGEGAGLVDVIGEDTPARPALALVPARIIQFEPITVQPVPGYEDYAVEGVFKTLQMNVEAQIPTLVYVRGEGLGAAADADARLAQLMSAYTLSPAQVAVGSVIAQQGWTPDQGAFARGWTSGSSVTFVKASFPEWIPEHHFEIIERQGIAVSEAVEVFQRTGLEGVQAQ